MKRLRARTLLSIGLLAATTLWLAPDPGRWGSSAYALPGGAPREVVPAPGAFLIAHPRMRDPRFAQSIVLLLRYGPGGAVGLIVNRPVEADLRAILPEAGLPPGQEVSVRYGGPVSRDDLIFLANVAPNGDFGAEVLPGVHSFGELRALRQVLAHPGADVRAFAGYAGWAPRQLDGELVRGDWLVVPADAASVFSEDLGRLWKTLHDWLTLPSA